MGHGVYCHHFRQSWVQRGFSSHPTKLVQNPTKLVQNPASSKRMVFTPPKINGWNLEMMVKPIGSPFPRGPHFQVNHVCFGGCSIYCTICLNMCGHFFLSTIAGMLSFFSWKHLSLPFCCIFSWKHQTSSLSFIVAGST